MNLLLFPREATSDVAGVRVLTDLSALAAIQLDYALAAGAALAVVERFLTPPSLPGRTAWDAGTWTLTLQVLAAGQISFTAELWRTDASGLTLAQIGARPAVATGTGAVVFAFTGAAIAAALKDRLLLRVLAQNDNATAGGTLSLQAGTSSLQTPLPYRPAARHPSLRRGKFLGVFRRPGLPRPDADGFVTT